MLDTKTLNLLEMAERGELPVGLHYPDGKYLGCGRAIQNGKLTEDGKHALSYHREWAELARKFADTPRIFGCFSDSKSDLTAIHSQLGELKYKTESLQERVGQNASAFSTQIGELTKKVEKLEEPQRIKFGNAVCFCCNCGGLKNVEPEQPALEWEVWVNHSKDAAFRFENDANEYRTLQSGRYKYLKSEVRHNPKQVNKER